MQIKSLFLLLLFANIRHILNKHIFYSFLYFRLFFIFFLHLIIFFNVKSFFGRLFLTVNCILCCSKKQIVWLIGTTNKFLGNVVTVKPLNDFSTLVATTKKHFVIVVTITKKIIVWLFKTTDLPIY